MLIGSYVSGAGYGLACNGWPLCNGEVIPSVGGSSVQVHYLHRVLAGLLGLTLGVLGWLAWRSRIETPFISRITTLALAVYAAQVLLGAANVWTQLAQEVSAAHLGFGALLWSTLAVLNIRVYRLHEVWPLSRRNASNRLAGDPR